MSSDTAKPLGEVLTRHQLRLIEASARIRARAADKIDFLHSVNTQCGLPYRNPGESVREWERQQGHVTLRIEAGAALDPATRHYVPLGLPYGEKPRLVLIHLASEAVRTGDQVVNVEDSMTAFARTLGFDTNGPSLRGLKEQLARLAAATIRFGFVAGEHAAQINTQIVTAFDLWYPRQPDQRVLWPSTVRLSDEFFHSLATHAVPLDNRAIVALANSSMALDIYVWLAQRLHRVPPGKPQFRSWKVLYEQFGQGFARVRDFRRKFLETLRHVSTVYPSARLETNEHGMSLHQSPSPVPARRFTGGQLGG